MLRVTSGAAAGAEVLYDGCMSKAGCVYSFGVVLWELLAGSRAWAGLNHAQVRPRAAARLRSALA
jgi:predicted component of type VI protein secretion system